VLRHRHLVSYIISSVEFLGCDPAEAQLICVPPYHIAGIAAVLSSLYAGRRILYLPTFDAAEWVRVATAESITNAMVVPTMLGRILAAVEEVGAAPPALRHLSYGGGRMPLELVERTLTDLPHVDLVNAYGLTETSSTIAMLTPDDHREAFSSSDPAVHARLGSVGRPLPTLEVEVRGPEGEPLAAGEKGEIWVRGEQVAGEYVGRSMLTEDGWFQTRDAGWFDAEGFLYVDGRLDDVIVRGAENISPGEVEDVLQAHPAVAEAAVVGIPDTEWGEAVAAVVVLRPDAPATTSSDELQAWVRERLRSTKTPVVIDFRDELPYSPTGKLLRRVLRDELAGAS
jgi:acyl-CoA synthetase (AMP-forming)/AMP-acid ligase II